MATHTLDLKQSLSTKLSQRMQQAIHLLQLPHQELNALVDTYVMGNPFLELKEEHAASDETQPDTSTYDDAPVWQDGDESMLEPIFSKKYTVDDEYTSAQNVSEPITLKRFVTQQIYIHCAHSPYLACALFLTDLLCDDGFLPPHLYAVAKESGYTRHMIDNTLTLLHTLDPVGVFARSMQENIYLQLKDQGHTDPILFDIVHLLWPDHRYDLHTVSADSVNQLRELSPQSIQKTLKLSDDQWAAYMHILKNVPLRPGAAFSSEDAVHVRIPDIFMRQQGDQRPRIELNAHTLPPVYVNSAYYMELKKKGLSATDKAFIHEKYTEAKWLLKSIHQRAVNILKVGESILARQEAFFSQHDGALAPLTLKDIAEDAGLSESTVSRITQGKYMETPRGLFELKHFFTKHIKNSLAPNLKSAHSIQHKIEHMIKQEDPRAPLSDQKIVEHLQMEGAYVARRTVAKYRDVLGLGNTTERAQTYKWQQRHGKILSF